MCKVEVLNLRVRGSRAQISGFRFQVSGFRVQGSGKQIRMGYQDPNHENLGRVHIHFRYAFGPSTDSGRVPGSVGALDGLDELRASSQRPFDLGCPVLFWSSSV